MINDLVSIIIPCYNSEKYIAETIYSTLIQTYSNFEVIIIDDNSTDSSLSIIYSYIQKDSRITLITLSNNLGVSNARNIGISAAKGQYIAFLDSDDLWLPKKLEMQIGFMKKNNYFFSFTAYEKVNKRNKTIGRIGVPDKINYHSLLKANVIGCLTVVYDRTYFGPRFMNLKTKREDYVLWLELTKEINYAAGLNQILAQYRIHETQSSKNKFNMSIENWKIYINIEKLSYAKAIYYFTHYLIRGFLRSKMPYLARILGLLVRVD